jgi:hypothetical protein
MFLLRCLLMKYSAGCLLSLRATCNLFAIRALIFPFCLLGAVSIASYWSLSTYESHTFSSSLSLSLLLQPTTRYRTQANEDARSGHHSIACLPPLIRAMSSLERKDVGFDWVVLTVA